MNINRNKIYEGLIQSGLKHLLTLKLNFNNAISIMKLLDHMDKMVKWFKTPFYLQITKYGGAIVKNAEKPPYYTFQNPTDKIAFESSFHQYINQDEKLDEFNIIDVEISNEDYNNLPKDLEVNLSGIVNIIVI